MTNWRAAARHDQALARRFYGACHARGVYWHDAWHHGFSVAHTPDDIDRVLNVAEDALSAIAAGRASSAVQRSRPSHDRPPSSPAVLQSPCLTRLSHDEREHGERNRDRRPGASAHRSGNQRLRAANTVLTTLKGATGALTKANRALNDYADEFDGNGDGALTSARQSLNGLRLREEVVDPLAPALRREARALTGR